MEPTATTSVANFATVVGAVAMLLTAIGGVVIGSLQLQTKKAVDNTHHLVNGRWSEMATQLVAAQERYMASEARYDALVNRMQKANDVMAEAAALSLLKVTTRADALVEPVSVTGEKSY